MADKVRIEPAQDGVYELKIDDPENENRMSDVLCDELKDALTRLAENRAIKVLVMTGTKDVFCAGATIETLRKMASGASMEDLTIPIQMLSFPVPIIAALEGHAVGGGLALAVCCDVIVAADTARYGFNFTSLGFTPGMGMTALLPELVGTAFATEMLLTAKFYKGRDLRHRRLFTHIAPQNDVLTMTWDIARSMADKPRAVLQMTKDVIAGPRRQAFQSAFPRECLMHKVCFSEPDIWPTITGNYMEKS
jgi:polyketide biosynthesis enoyl-CoA hydratase PksI